MTKDTVHYGIIGFDATDTSRYHDDLHDTGHAELVAVCDTTAPLQEPRDGDREASLAFPVYDDAMQLLNTSGLDAVVICEPRIFPMAYIYNAIDRGLHVLIWHSPAPKASELDCLRHVLQRASQKRLVVSARRVRRKHPPYVAARTRLNEWISRHGPLEHISMDLSCTKGVVQHVEGNANLIEHELLGQIDYVRFLLGPKEISPSFILRESERYAAYGAFKDKDEITLFFGASRHLTANVRRELVILRFLHGDVQLQSETGNMIETAHNSGLVNRSSCHAPSNDVSSLAIAKDFIEAIRFDREPYLTHDDILMSTDASKPIKERPMAASRT